jgi:drug/metabolite transporter (DMT)-like permease
MKVEYLLLLMMPVLVTFGQVLLKKNTGKVITEKGLFIFLKSLFSPGIIAGAVAVAAAPLLYIKALGAVELSEAFAFNSMNYILVFISGHFILKEEVNRYQVIGVILIASGFLLPFVAGGALDS